MNTDQLQKNVGQHLHLRPHPLIAQYFPRTIPVLTRRGGNSMVARRLEQTDHEWRLMAVTSGGVKLHCLDTNHEITLGGDNVREFRTPNFLMLWCQLTLDGDTVHVEPI